AGAAALPPAAGAGAVLLPPAAGAAGCALPPPQAPSASASRPRIAGLAVFTLPPLLPILLPASQDRARHDRHRRCPGARQAAERRFARTQPVASPPPRQPAPPGPRGTRLTPAAGARPVDRPGDDSLAQFAAERPPGIGTGRADGDHKC